MQEKKLIREEMLALRAGLHPSDKQRYDHSICDQLLQLVEETCASRVHTYLPMGDEVDIFPFIGAMLEKGLTVVAPKSLKGRRLENLVLHSLSELESGIYGTSHPASGLVYEDGYDLFIVPGLAFDQHGNRIGYGAGYYDAFLTSQSSGQKVGICYPFQLLDELPSEPHDVRLDGMIYG